MAGFCTLLIWTSERMVEERRITHDSLESNGIFQTDYVAKANGHAVLKRRFQRVFRSLVNSIGIDVDTRHVRLRKTLGHHQSYQSCTRADIKDTTAASRSLSPAAKQRPIGTHLHRTTLLADDELSELEVIVGHNSLQR
jgi:hypothetical protein